MSADMGNWDNLSWFQQDWAIPFLFSFITTALIGAVVWFVDGIRKYGYWLDEDKEIEDETDEVKEEGR